MARTNRRKFIPIAYLLVIVCLLLFSGILILDIACGGGLIGSSSETDLSRLVGYVFFVWLSVANLFVTSVFWAFMVDIYTVEQGKRVFAFIGIGGTLGALIGGWATSIISSSTESPYLPVGLMLTGAAFLAFPFLLSYCWSASQVVMRPARQSPGTLTARKSQKLMGRSGKD